MGLARGQDERGPVTLYILIIIHSLLHKVNIGVMCSRCHQKLVYLWLFREGGGGGGRGLGSILAYLFVTMADICLYNSFR